MTYDQLPEDFLELLRSVTAKRARRVIDHILEHGQVTTEELREKYDYNHPPRAARDVREQGIPLTTGKVTAKDGRTIGAYWFGDPAETRRDQLAGRRTFSKNFKKQLLELHRNRCAICATSYSERYLQVDHRVPYEVAGEGGTTRELKEYMPLCGTDNRAKSWSCENCNNWRNDRDPAVCMSCYWAHPESYEHVATQQQRRVDIVWHDNEVEQFDQLKRQAAEHSLSPAEYIKRLFQSN